MGPPPLLAGPLYQLNSVWGFLVFVVGSLLYCGVGIVLCLYCLWHYSRTSTNSHLSTVHTITLVSTSLQWPLFCVPKVAIVESGSTVYQIIGDCKCPQHQKTTTQFSSEH